MPGEVTTSNELNITLASADQSATRVIKLPNPKEELTLAQVKTAFAPAFNSDTQIYFFYDDGNQGGYETPMTQVTAAERVIIQKTVNPVT